MPEKTTISRKEQATRLSDRAHFEQIVCTHCKFCQSKRVYLIKDVMTLLGDVPVYSMASAMKCDNCGHSDYMTAARKKVNASDFGRLKVRRLEGIKTIRVPVWREDVL